MTSRPVSRFRHFGQLDCLLTQQSLVSVMYIRKPSTIIKNFKGLLQEVTILFSFCACHMALCYGHLYIYIYTSRKACLWRASLPRRSFNSGPLTALRWLSFHDRALNCPPPRYLCVPDLKHESLLLGIEPPFYTMYTQQRVRNLAFAICKQIKKQTVHQFS